MAVQRCQLQLYGAVILTVICLIHATTRYYGTYISFGTGDTMIYTLRTHLGPFTAGRKWHSECQDGEAVVGIQNWVNDYQNIDVIWCKYTFAYKPSTLGMYPFYPNCHIRNFTDQFFCFTPSELKLTVDTFVTAFWDNEQNFFVARPGPDSTNRYKCCKPPPGYYIDYTSCYYQPTHDQYWEFYDSLPWTVVNCANGFVMTGIAKKFGPIVRDTAGAPLEWHVDWIQCCRVGFSGQRTINSAIRLPDNTTATPAPFGFG